MQSDYYYTIQYEDNGYCAYIPAFKATVVDDNLQNLEEAIQNTIETCIEICKSEKHPIPPPDNSINASGKIALRLPKSLHRKIIFQAKSEGVSMNQYILSKLAV